jgi:hypothetical protein
MKFIDPNKLYKKSGNKIDIIPSNHSYNYGNKIDNMICYIFDKELFCKCISTPKLLTKITHISEMWPKDVFPIFISLLETTFDQPQTLHIIINGIHVLFTTHLLMSLKEKVQGVIMNEIPYSQVELFKQPTPVFHFFQNILIDRHGVIHGMERNNWDNMIKQMHFTDKWKSENLLNQNVLKHFPEDVNEFYIQLFNSIQQGDSAVQFMICSVNDNTLISYFNSVGVFDNGSEKKLLVTQEVIDEEVMTVEIPEKTIIYNLHNVMDQCIVCKRVRLQLSDYYKDYYARNIGKDIHSIEPLLHPSQKLPWLGRRGILGYQHEECQRIIKTDGVHDCIQVWELPQKYNIINHIVKKFKPSVCKICCEEWQWLLLTINKNLNTSSPKTSRSNETMGSTNSSKYFESENQEIVSPE